MLFEFFAGFQDTDRLEFAHEAEFVGLARIAARIDTSVVEMFDPDYAQLLAAARTRLAAGHDGEYPGPGSVRLMSKGCCNRALAG